MSKIPEQRVDRAGKMEVQEEALKGLRAKTEAAKAEARRLMGELSKLVERL